MTEKDVLNLLEHCQNEKIKNQLSKEIGGVNQECQEAEEFDFDKMTIEPKKTQGCLPIAIFFYLLLKFCYWLAGK